MNVTVLGTSYSVESYNICPFILQVEKLRHTEAGYIIPGHKTGETGSVGLDPGLWDP